MLLIGIISIIAADQSLVAYWSFDAPGVGNSYPDISGNGHDAIWTGAEVSLATGIKGNALNCPETGYEIIAKDSKNVFSLKQFTLECWFYPYAGTSFKIEIFNYQPIGDSYNGYGLQFTQNNTAEPITFYMSPDVWAGCNHVVKANNWYHIVCIWNDDENLQQIYFNGTFAGEMSGYPNSIGTFNTDARIGCKRITTDSVGNFTNGKIDELKLYNYILPKDSILAHYTEHKRVPVLVPPIQQNKSTVNGITLLTVLKQGKTSIVYSLDRDGIVTMDIFSLSGQYVATLLNEYSSSGTHTFIWNGMETVQVFRIV